MNTYTNLFLHGDGEQNYKVQNKDRPEYGDVEEIKQRTQHADKQRLQCTVPADQHVHLVY